MNTAAKKNSESCRFVAVLHRFEDFLLVAFLGAMLLIAAAQIGLRNVMGMSLMWGDPLTEHIMLWAGLLGASLATRQRKHIAIDVLANPLPSSIQSKIRCISDLLSSLICTFLVYASIIYLNYEYQEHSTTFWGLPVWLVLSIFPLTFALMAFRFFVSALSRR